jgi:hypothetical protein
MSGSDLGGHDVECVGIGRGLGGLATCGDVALERNRAAAALALTPEGVTRDAIGLGLATRGGAIALTEGFEFGLGKYG